MGNNTSSPLGDQTPKMMDIPTYMNIRQFYPNTTLGLYHFKDGNITLEKRIPAKLEEGEDRLRETAITLMEPHTPRVDVALAFDFPEPLGSLFIRLANTCKDGTVEQLESVDAEIQSNVHISMLSDRLMLEPLLCIAIAIKNFALVKALATRGAPPPENETRFLWNWRGDVARGYGISDPSATTALLRHRWLKVEDAYADQYSEIPDEAMAIDRINALFEVGYGFIPTASDHVQAKYYWFLRRGIAKAPVPVLRHLVSRVPIPRGVPLFGSLVPAAASRIKDGPGTIELLLDQGLKVDARQESWDGPRRTALHTAVQASSVPNVKCLLQHGAKMLRDADGKTPLGLAEQLHREEVVRVLRDHLQDKGLSFDHADQEPIVPSI
ncbi:hypothetical protein F4677DRAFT_402288 [Hypoxylon crocopeplum]|nr:hypothetical protein F4677DRAFT_402288 [Hypoxylon crocopeplum]